MTHRKSRGTSFDMTPWWWLWQTKQIWWCLRKMLFARPRKHADPFHGNLWRRCSFHAVLICKRSYCRLLADELRFNLCGRVWQKVKECHQMPPGHAASLVFRVFRHRLERCRCSFEHIERDYWLLDGDICAFESSVKSQYIGAWSRLEFPLGNGIEIWVHRFSMFESLHSIEQVAIWPHLREGGGSTLYIKILAYQQRSPQNFDLPFCRQQLCFSEKRISIL